MSVCLADVDYTTDVKPLLAEKCTACHGVLKQESDLRLDSRQSMLDGGDSGAAISPGNSDESLILQRITSDDESRMPPPHAGSALSKRQVTILTDWIDNGAVAPNEQVADSPLDHWAFQTIRKPEVPKPGFKHPIDAFLAEQWQTHGLKPQPAAERSQLLRRLYLDLIGLPPSTDQLQDVRPIIVIIDELLNSPHHGERWGRHWMDVWRYSDWYGLNSQLRVSQKHMWHWRDWIVDSLNADKGYDRMIHEMLAGDELAPGDSEAIAGTGFLARNYYLFNRTTWLDATIEHTGKAFLGLTLNCAKCHDHKYDPISHKDYYQFRAFFEPHQIRLDPVPGVTNLETDGLPRAFDDHPDKPTFLHQRGDPQSPDRETQIRPVVPELFAAFQPAIQPVSLPVEAYVPAVRMQVLDDLLAEQDKRIGRAETELRTAEQSAPSDPNSPKPRGNFEFHDDFTALDREAWDLTGSGWVAKDGQLHQTVAQRGPAFARLRSALPHNFEVRCRYTTTGGNEYKSVTFHFDQSEDGTYSNYVYSSAHAPRPKIQVAYQRLGKSVYPAKASRQYPITVGMTYDLRFAVRGNLVNVWVDDEFQVAWKFPDRRLGGFLAISGFDATVSFDDIKVTSLPADTSLTAADNAPSTTGTNNVVSIAKAEIEAARKAKEALRAIYKAETAKQKQPDAMATKRLITLATVAQADARLAEADYDTLRAGENKDQRKAAEAKRRKAIQQRDSVEAGQSAYDLPRVSQKALEGPDHKPEDYPQIYPSTSSGRRLSLARWITSRKNPLTARVAVNHVWMRHFGEPLVVSVFDFGLRAPQPIHQELLDYLAADFMENGWSLRHLHRLIVTSAAYQRTSSTRGADANTQKADAANKYLWRMNYRRMESQLIRDCLLQLAGQLDRTIGGPSLDVSEGQRRSIYFRHSRDDQNRFLSMFDDADLLQCYRRSESIVPQQALALANSRLSLTSAAAIASTLEQQIPGLDESDSKFIAAAFQLLLCRDATDAEHAECSRFFEQLDRLLKKQDLSAMERQQRLHVRLIHSLLNHNDFVTIR